MERKKKFDDPQFISYSRYHSFIMETIVHEMRKEGNKTRGAQYQDNLTLATWLRADRIYRENYQILPEWVLAGILDDVVLKYKIGNQVHYRFLQAKHSSNDAQIHTVDQFFEKNEFKIEKYFESYEDFHKNFKNEKIDDLIIFTNLALKIDVEQYVTELPADDPIFQFEQKKKNGKTPIMHKLNENFIEKHKNIIKKNYNGEEKLRCVVKSFIKCCVNDPGEKQSDDLFEGCKFIITQEIANVKERIFHSNFIEGKGLSEGTEQFRKIFLKESAPGVKQCSSPEAERGYLAKVKLKFLPGFGISERHKKTKDWPFWTKKKEDLFREFCGLIRLATSQPNETELIKYIEVECEKKRRHPNSATERLKIEIRDWYNNNKVPFKLDSISLKRIMSRTDPDEMGGTFIKQTKMYIEELSSFKIQFRIIPYEEELKFFLKQSEKNEFHLNTKGSVKVSLLKLFNCLERLQQTDYLFCPKAEISQIDKFSEVFRDSEVFKILVCEIQSVEINHKFKKKVKDLTNKNKEIKIIIIKKFNIEEQEVINSHLFPTVEDLTLFQDLTEGIQKELLERKISFQGAEVAFNSISDKGIPPNHQDIESWGILLDKQIEMNNTSGKFDSTCYINRTLAVDLPYFHKDTIQQELGDQHIVTYNNHDFHERIKRHPTKNVHELFNLKELWCWRRSNRGIKELLKFKIGTEHFESTENLLCQSSAISVISDNAGYGKTTTTLFLAEELQKQHPNCWVTQLQPTELTFDKKEIILTPEADFGKYDAFLMKKLFKLRTPLERIIFKQYLEDEESNSQLFFIFDGFNEIDGNYQKVIIEALKYLKLKRNVKFIGITTRPQHQDQLEEELQAGVYKLLPFDHENKIEYLENFWFSRGVEGESLQLRKYSERLIHKISKSISDEKSELTAIPLQMRIIGEFYEKDAIKHLAGDLRENEIGADLFGLYDESIKIKADIYVIDKLGLISNKEIDRKKESLRKSQLKFAIEVILRRGSLYLTDELNESLDFGIIQKNQGEYSFIHRTFAEFLTATYFLDYSLSVLAKVNNGELMAVLWNWKYPLVRQFINSRLNHERMAFPLKKTEYKEPIMKIRHKEFEEAMETSVEEDIFKILCFLLEFYWYFHPNEMKQFVFSTYKNHEKRGLLELLSLKECIPSSPIHWMTTEWLDTEHDALLQTLSFLIRFVFTKKIYKNSGIAVKVVLDLQDKLEDERILSRKDLENILYEIPFKLQYQIRWEKLTMDYLEHLKIKHEQLFYTFLKKKRKFVQTIVLSEGNQFYELILETEKKKKKELNMIFDIFVVSVFTEFKLFTKNCINLENYLKFISKYVGDFSPQQLKKFKNYLIEYIQNHGWYYKQETIPQGRILFEFLKNHLGIKFLYKFMQKMKIQKNLSFIENCALWGWADLLEFILIAGNIEVDVVKKLQLNGFDSLHTNIERILIPIRKYSYEKLIATAKVIHRYHFWKIRRHKFEFLFNTYMANDKCFKEIYLPWITTNEIFDDFMKFKPLRIQIIEFVIERFPQYKMRYFKIRKNDFLKYSPFRLRGLLHILEDDDKINKEEFLELLQLQDSVNEDTILFKICTAYHCLGDWLEVLQRKCTLGDIVRLFQIKNVRGRTAFEIIDYESQLDEERQRKCKRKLFNFFDELNLVSLIKELNVEENPDEEDSSDEEDCFYEEESTDEEEYLDEEENSEWKDSSDEE